MTQIPLLDVLSFQAERISSWWSYSSRQYYVTEKPPGERCLLQFEGSSFTAHSQSTGQACPVPPQADTLEALSKPFVLDGYADQNTYTVSDLLFWNGEDIRPWPFQRRITLLKEAFFDKKLIKRLHPTPMTADAQMNSTQPGLALLLPEEGERLADSYDLRTKTEGILIRDRIKGYGVKGSLFLCSFTDQLHAIVVGINPAKVNVMKLGLRRVADNALVSCGEICVSREDFQFFTEKLMEGSFPVLRVEYTPSRVKGVEIVDGRATRESVAAFPPWDCTTGQLPSQHRLSSLIKKAPRISGVQVWKAS